MSFRQVFAANMLTLNSERKRERKALRTQAEFVNNGSLAKRRKRGNTLKIH